MLQLWRGDTLDDTVAQFAQAVGAIFYGCMGLL